MSRWLRHPDVRMGGVLAVLLAGIALALRHAIPDDAYIYLRVAVRWAEGLGFTYNPGGDVNPCTSLGFPLLLCAGAKALPFVPAQAVLLLVYAVYWWVLGMTVWWGSATRPLGSRLALVALVVFQPLVLRSVGMESTFLLAFAGAAGLLLARDRPGWAGLVGGAAMLARPEGPALVGVLLIASFLSRRPGALRVLLGGLMVPAVLVAWQAATGGEVVPHTAQVKALQSGIGEWALRDPWWMQWLTAPLLPWLTWPLAGWGSWLLLRECLREGRVALLVLYGFGMAQGLAYSVLGAPPIYFWYSVPAHLATSIAVYFALVDLGRRVVQRFAPSGKAEAASGPCLCVPAALLLTLSFLGADLWKWPGTFRLSKEYKDVAVWIDLNLPEDVRVASVELGYVGYYCRRPMVDPHGLLHREALPHLEAERWHWWYETYRPEVILLKDPMPWFGEPREKEWPPELLADFRASYTNVVSSGRMQVWVEGRVPPVHGDQVPAAESDPIAP